MATGYGIYSTNIYERNELNMAISEADWFPGLVSEQPDVMTMSPSAWTVPLKWGDRHHQIHKGFHIAGMTLHNTDAGYLYAMIDETSGLTLYRDRACIHAVGKVEPNSSAFTELNSSELYAAEDWDFELSSTPTPDGLITLKVSTVEIELDKLRAQVADRIVTLLLQRLDVPVKKPEYLKRLHDKRQLRRAEVFCGLMIFFQKQRDGDIDDATSTLEQLYTDLLHEELKRHLQWDTSITVEEEAPQVRATVGTANIFVDFI